jgi:pimeloyl-ACP methyl ester carboxylesterase
MRALVETIEVDGARLRLRTLAPAGRSRDSLEPTLVLLHGLGSSSAAFRRLQTVLSRGHRTIAVDLPGFGGMPDVGWQLRTPDLAERVVDALRAVDVVECVVLGHGWGAQLAVEVARRSSDFVTSVALLAPVVDDRRRGLWRQLGDLGVDLFHEPVGLGARVTLGLLRNLVVSLPLVPGALRYPLFTRVAELDVPVLVLRGYQDALSGHDWARRLAGVAGEAALLEIPGAHHVQDQQAGAVGAIVDEFIRVQTLGRLR